MTRLIYISLIVIVALGCRQNYNPKPNATATNYQVVEGLINTGTDSTIIKLSRTVPLNSKTATIPEPGATVTITSITGAAFPCIEAGGGGGGAAGGGAAAGRGG